MRQRMMGVLVGVAVLVGGQWVAGEAREYGGRYTAERLRNARANCEKYEWAAKVRAEAVKAAEPWVRRSDEELWGMVPGQDLPRTIDTTLDRRVKDGPKRLGCLKCGEKIFRHGNYPYEPDIEGRPWRLTCPSCGVVFPTNDFGKYYASGIDERGLFNPKKADRSLLFNAEHPDPKDPLHKFGVDDGFGYVDGNGREHRFVAYYAWKYWRYVLGGVTNLANAYVYTGDKRYAHKAAVLIDRIADVYPEMNWTPYARRGYYHSDGNSDFGKIEGRIWETQNGRTIPENYDKILSGTVGDEELFAFLKRQSERYKTPSPKGTRELFVANVDERLLREVFRGVVAGHVSGNEGMHQLAVAICAMALDTEPETGKWLDWLFDPTGGAIPGLIVSKFDRDGVSPEAGPGYALMWGTHLSDVAGRLSEYEKYTKHNIFRDFPQFRATFTAAWRMAALGVAVPNIGDHGETGTVGRYGSPQFIATGYRYTKDPEIAVAAYRANGNSGAGLGRDILAEDPDWVGKEIEEIGRTAGARPARGELMSGYGLATLESGEGERAVAVPVYYGRTIFHGHPDQLNFDLLAFGRWLAPDLGYPEFATNWPSRNEWNNNSISHNLVVIDGEGQKDGYGGKTRFFKSLPGLAAVEAWSKSAYPKVANEYSRMMAAVEAPGGQTYVVDVFRVGGGKDHVMSFHGPPGVVTAVEGLELVEQGKGTYAGEGVPFAASPGAFPRGYQYLYDVRRDAKPAGKFVLDWHADPKYRGLKLEDVHLRMHALTACDDVALAHGDPAQNRAANPRRLTYALLHRAGDKGLASTFASVLEPYRGEPFVKSVERLAVGDEQVVAIRVMLADGHVDTVVFNPGDKPVRLEDGTQFAGRLAMVRRKGEQVVKAAMVEGSELRAGEAELKGRAAVVGKVVRMNREMAGGGIIWTDAEVPTDGSVVGQQVVVANENERDACYTIRGVTREGGLSRIDCGPISFVRSYTGPMVTVRGQAVPADYSKGYLYDFEEGAELRVPGHAVWERR